MTAAEIGKANALEAIDQADNYGGLEEAIDAYLQNVIDTCSEYGIDAYSHGGAIDLFVAEVRKVVPNYGRE